MEVGCESLPGLLGYEFLCISARIRLLGLYCLLSKPKFLVRIFNGEYPSGFVGQKVGLLLCEMDGLGGGHSPYTERRPSPGFQQPVEVASQHVNGLTRPLSGSQLRFAWQRFEFFGASENRLGQRRKISTL